MQEEGKIISIEKDMAYVQINIGKVCHECKVCDRSAPIILEADNSIGANVGQQVRLETKIMSKIKEIILYLILPPLILIFGIITGSLIANYLNLSDKLGEIVGVILGLLLFILSLLFACWLEKRNKNKRLSSKIIEIIDSQ